MKAKKLIIAIDGHSSCGKSTFAKAIAKKMDFLYIDSGAMYRAVTLACIDSGIISAGKVDTSRLIGLLKKISISFRQDGTRAHTILNGVDVEERIRTIEVASSVSEISKYREVREKLVEMQRELGKDKSIVMDGRDIGTVVFPDADIKIFMTAKPEIRAERRYKELLEKGHVVSLDEVLRNIVDRDRQDENRQESPLIKAPDAVVLDNSYMTPAGQMKWFKNLLSVPGY
jgi:CMP/dCMP kinase